MRLRGRFAHPRSPIDPLLKEDSDRALLGRLSMQEISRRRGSSLVRLVKQNDNPAYSKILDCMFKDRKNVFVDTLKWDIPYDEYGERDQFDNTSAEYLVLSDPGTSNHLASVRVLRTERPHLLSSLFPTLCDGAVPCGVQVREISRLCLSPRRRAREKVEYKHLLASAMTEYALLSGITGYTAVTDLSRMSRLLSIGWRCEPLGMPLQISNSPLVALMIHMDPDTIRRLQLAGTYRSCALRLEEYPDLAA